VNITGGGPDYYGEEAGYVEEDFSYACNYPINDIEVEGNFQTPWGASEQGDPQHCDPTECTIASDYRKWQCDPCNGDWTVSTGGFFNYPSQADRDQDRIAPHVRAMRGACRDFFG
jgi:hypothetical protein